MSWSAWQGNNVARLRKRGVVRGSGIEMRTTGAARAVKMRSFADLKLNTRCATLGGMVITTNSNLLHRVISRRRPMQSAQAHPNPAAPLTTVRAPILIATRVRIESAVTHSKQMIETNSNRNKFGGCQGPNHNPPLALSTDCRFLIANRRLESLATHSKQSTAPCSNREKKPIASSNVIPHEFFTSHKSRVMPYESKITKGFKWLTKQISQS